MRKGGKSYLHRYNDWEIQNKTTKIIQGKNIACGRTPRIRATMAPIIRSFLSPRLGGEKYSDDVRSTAKIRGVMRESWPSEVEMNESASSLYDLSGEQARANPAMLGNATGQSGGLSHLMVADSGLTNEGCEIGRKVFFGFHRLA